MNTSVSLDPLRLSLSALTAAISEHAGSPDNELMRDGLIQRFEFTYEMAWKTVKRYLESEHQETGADQWSRRDLFRMAAEVGIIDDPNEWFGYMRLRNLSSHTYNNENAEKVAAAVPAFAKDCEAMLQRLAERLTDASPD